MINGLKSGRQVGEWLGGWEGKQEDKIELNLNLYIPTRENIQHLVVFDKAITVKICFSWLFQVKVGLEACKFQISFLGQSLLLSTTILNDDI